jgi:hypothetical protein
MEACIVVTILLGFTKLILGSTQTFMDFVYKDSLVLEVLKRDPLLVSIE